MMWQSYHYVQIYSLLNITTYNAKRKNYHTNNTLFFHITIFVVSILLIFIKFYLIKYRILFRMQWFFLIFLPYSHIKYANCKEMFLERCKVFFRYHSKLIICNIRVERLGFAKIERVQKVRSCTYFTCKSYQLFYDKVFLQYL